MAILSGTIEHRLLRKEASKIMPTTTDETEICTTDDESSLPSLEVVSSSLTDDSVTSASLRNDRLRHRGDHDNFDSLSMDTEPLDIASAVMDAITHLESTSSPEASHQTDKSKILYSGGSLDCKPWDGVIGFSRPTEELFTADIVNEIISTFCLP